MLTKEKFLRDKISLCVKSPESNEDYVKLIKKLIELGWKTYDNISAENFSHYTWVYLPHIDEEYFEIHPRNKPDGQLEIKVSDILENNQFEAGKWYKYNNWYIKLKEITPTNIFIASDYIDDEKIYAGNLNWFTCGNADFKKVLLTDLSEIQQYLPDGHPDKLPKTIEKWSVGSYVVFIKEDIRRNIGDIDKIIPNKTKDCNFITLEEYGFYNIGVEEVKWFAILPEAEAFSKSLLESDEDKPKFKIGDYVITNRYSSCYNGRILRITKFSDRYPDIAYFEVFDDGYYSKNDNFSLDKVERFATSEEIAKVTKPEPKESKEFDRNWYIEVSSQEEADKVFDWLRSQGEIANNNSPRRFGECWNTIRYFRGIPSPEWDFGYVNSDILVKKQLSDILPNCSKVNRNVYYEVSNQEEYEEILDWLESMGEIVFHELLLNHKGYILFWKAGKKWAFNDTPAERPKAEFPFKSKQSIKVDTYFEEACPFPSFGGFSVDLSDVTTSIISEQVICPTIEKTSTNEKVKVQLINVPRI